MMEVFHPLKLTLDELRALLWILDAAEGECLFAGEGDMCGEQIAPPMDEHVRRALARAGRLLSSVEGRLLKNAD